MQTRSCRVGIHGRNRPTFEDHDYHLIQEMRAETVKMMTRQDHTDLAVYENLKRDHPNVEIITRLDHSDINRGDHPDKGSHPPPDKYANDLTDTVRSLLPFCTKFQITNEPNHAAKYEGWGIEDELAKDYNAWFVQVYRRLKDAVPEATFGFPGLAVPDFLHRDRAWLDICSEAINEADWLGVHCYWQTPPQQESVKFDESFGTCFKHYHRLFPNKVLEILECGNSNSQAKTPPFPISDEAIAQEYVDWLQELFNYPYIGSASFFIISSPDPDWVGFSWRHEDGRFKPVVRLVGEMDRPALVAPTAQPTPEAAPATVAVVTTPAAEVTDYTNQDVIDAFRKAANRLGLGNWDLMGKTGLMLSKLAEARQATYSGPKLAELAQLTPDEKEKIRAMLPAITPAAGAELSFSIPTSSPSPVATGWLKSRPNLVDAPLAFPCAEQLSLAQAEDSTERLVIRTWNRYGWLLLLTSDALQIESGAAVTVVSQHFRGRGFGADGRMRLRFEPYLFFEKWGRDNEAQFQQHFKFNPDHPWQQHQWRPAKNQAWRDVHNNQDSEWAAFELACILDETTAQHSITMGAPELIGSLHAAIGYDTVDQMFAAFASHERYQLFGLFDFTVGPDSNSRQLAALQKKDFEIFAAMHHGPGQAARYASTLHEAYNRFQKLNPI